MPEGSTSEGFLLQQKGPGTVNFPPISFLYPGKHLYSVTQLPGKTRHYTYDPAGYTLEVILQSTPAGLAPTVILSKEGMEEKAGELVFVNRYDPPSSDQPHTGDDFPLTLWVGLNVGSGLALAATAAVQLKKKRT